MNTLTRWEPLREMEDLQDRLSTLFGRTPMRRGNGKESITLPEWTPLADITEDDREYVIKSLSRTGFLLSRASASSKKKRRRKNITA
jgi:hypothetical protein